MCDFFSFNSDGKSNFYYFTPKLIKQIEQEGNPRKLNFNSHASIAEYFKLKEDNCNKYEYNPFTREFKDQTSALNNDSTQAKKWVRAYFDLMPRTKLKRFYLAFMPKVDYATWQNNARWMVPALQIFDNFP